MILVTGAAGMVGSYFEAERSTFTESLDLTDIDTLDVRDWETVRERIGSRRYSAVIHLAAETDVDRCEREPSHAFGTNAIGTQNVALACQLADIPLLYVSTAGVFGGDGKLGPFTEYDVPSPANVYGQSKLAGERHVERLLSRYYIVRAGWMMGGRERDKKFVAKIVEQIRQGRDILAVSDKIGSPTYAAQLVGGIRMLMATHRYGLYHMTNRGSCSRHDIACQIARFFGSQVTVRAVNSAHFPLPAARASSEVLRNLNLELLGIDPMTTWEEALDAYLREWFSVPA